MGKEKKTKLASFAAKKFEGFYLEKSPRPRVNVLWNGILRGPLSLGFLKSRYAGKVGISHTLLHRKVDETVAWGPSQPYDFCRALAEASATRLSG